MFGKSKKKKSRSGGDHVTPKLTSNPLGGLDDPVIISTKKSKRKKKGHRRFSSERWEFIRPAVLTGIAVCVLMLVYFIVSLPSIEDLNSTKKQPGITIKTEDGMVLTSYGEVYGEYIDYDQLPKPLIHAVLATEDRRFFEHNGIDFWGIARAMFVNVRAGRLVQGGSTITQQVAKNLFLTPERTLKRKIQEMFLAFWLEARYSKKEIMAIYLNRVYLGAGNFGVDAAATRYFDKSAKKLNLIESAVMAGLLKAPSKFSPVANPKKAKDRAHQVLINMADAGYLSESKIKPALDQFVAPKSYRADASGYRYYTDWIMDELPEYVGAIDQDLEVITTLNPNFQKYAEEAVTKIMDEMSAAKNASQAALVAMAPDGAVRAMVGGRDYNKSQFNRAVQSKRQPGSVFKLFVYLAALDSGMTPDSKVVDQSLEIKVGRKVWRPKNFTEDFRGEITMREGLTHSINTIAVQLAMSVGLQKVVNMAKRLGIDDIVAAPSIALGSVEANLLELTGAYAHIANEGRGLKPYGILEIYSQNGDEIYSHEDKSGWVVLRKKITHQMNDMLIHVTSEGTGRAANIGRPIAGKTGTSSDHKDAWFIGFVPQLVTGVWVGNDDNTVMKRVTGGNLPALIWRNFMQMAVKGMPVKDIPFGWQNESDEQEDTTLPWKQHPNASSTAEEEPAETGDSIFDVGEKAAEQDPQQDSSSAFNPHQGSTTQPLPLMPDDTPDGELAPEAEVASPAGTTQPPATPQPQDPAKVIEMPADQLPTDDQPTHNIWDNFFEKIEEPQVEYDYPETSPREKSLEQ